MERGALLNIFLERGALSCIGAWSGNANRGWSVERWVCVERGAMKSNSLGAWSEYAKIGRSAEHWIPGARSAERGAAMLIEGGAWSVGYVWSVEQ